eukprot:6349171-Ditylum_brightwellii.AAC.1
MLNQQPVPPHHMWGMPCHPNNPPINSPPRERAWLDFSRDWPPMMMEGPLCQSSASNNDGEAILSEYWGRESSSYMDPTMDVEDGVEYPKKGMYAPTDQNKNAAQTNHHPKLAMCPCKSRW